MEKYRISDNNKTSNGSHTNNHLHKDLIDRHHKDSIDRHHKDSIDRHHKDLIDRHHKDLIDPDHEDLIDEKKLSPIIVNRNRKLTIYTWGNKIRKTCPHQTDFNFNVRHIKRKKNGVKVNHRDGRTRAIQKMIINGRGFSKCLEEILDHIEKFNFTKISIYCAKGRHRSVSYAELLKKYYYPRATIHHLELLPFDQLDVNHPQFVPR